MEFDGVELTILISSIIMIIMVLLVYKICLAGRRPAYDDSTRCVRYYLVAFPQAVGAIARTSNAPIASSLPLSLR